MSGSEGGPNLDAYIKRRRRRRMAGILLVLLLSRAAHRPAGIQPCLRYRSDTPGGVGHRLLESERAGRLLILGSRVMLFSRKGTVAIEAEGIRTAISRHRHEQRPPADPGGARTPARHRRHYRRLARRL